MLRGPNLGPRDAVEEEGGRLAAGVLCTDRFL